MKLFAEGCSVALGERANHRKAIKVFRIQMYRVRLDINREISAHGLLLATFSLVREQQRIASLIVLTRSPSALFGRNEVWFRSIVRLLLRALYVYHCVTMTTTNGRMGTRTS